MRQSSVSWWRAARTGFCFAVFGLGGLVLSLVVFPVLLLVVRDPDRRRRKVRAIVHRAFWLFFLLMHGVRGFTYEITGSDRLGRPGQLIIANHPTLIDVVMLIGLTPASCVVKEALFRNPFVRRVVQAAGYISNRSTSSMIEGAIEALRAGDTLIMFPEGTRTRQGRPLEFHRGAASIAVQAATVLTPVYITSEPVFLSKQQAWYDWPRTRPHLTLRVGDDFDLRPYRGLPPPKASRMLNDRLLSHYAQVLGLGDGYNGAGSEGESDGLQAAARPWTTEKDRGVTSS